MSSSRAGVLVEFLLCIPLLVVFFFSMVSMGKKLYEITVLTNITRGAAVLASTNRDGAPVCALVENFIKLNLTGLGLDPLSYKLPETQKKSRTCNAVMSDMIRIETIPGTGVAQLVVRIEPCIKNSSIVTIMNNSIGKLMLPGFDASVQSGMALDSGVNYSC